MHSYSHHTGSIHPLWKLPVCFFLLLVAFASVHPIKAADPPLEHRIAEVQTTDPARSQGTLRVFAVMVAFKKDDNRFTTGDGSFQLDFLANPAIPITIDPLPHNQAYFESHLRFMSQYYKRVSGGKLNIEWVVYPQVLSLDKTMDQYAPLGEDGKENSKLFDLMKDTWTALGQQGGFDARGFDEDRDAFILFHAGSGRDINFLGTSLDRTPQDIPSLYVDLAAMRSYASNPSFGGFEIPTAQGGRFRIKNTLILPQTASRPGKDITESPYVLQLSINGLLTATMGNHLGLPDLYNTQDGSSAIGKFGLMDGAGFFSYFGLFPPEPSAWEKVRLGWIEPTLLDPTTSGTFSLIAQGTQASAGIYKISITQDEYFLVENRVRDPQNDGLRISVRTPNGALVSRQLPVFDDLFGSNLSDSLARLLPAGVLEEVDHYDWSLPGGLDLGSDNVRGTADDRFLNGGILIWHIDEAVLRAGNYRSGVNNNPLRRGVDLEEADGSQDIGFKTNNPFLAGFTSGTAFDFWWSGNDARVILNSGQEVRLYQNRFAPNTKPDNNSYTGAQSRFELHNFSGSRVNAQFSLRPFSSATAPPLYVNTSLAAQIYLNPVAEDGFPTGLWLHATASDTVLIVPSPTHTYALGVGRANQSYRERFTLRHPQQPWTIGNRLFLASKPTMIPESDGVISYVWENGSYQKSWQVPMVSGPGFVSQTSPGILDLDFTALRFNLTTGATEASYKSPTQWSATLNQRRFENTPAQLQSSDAGLRWSKPTGSGQGYALTLQEQNGQATAALFVETKRWTLISDRHPNGNILQQGTGVLGWPALADWDSDGRTDLIGLETESQQLIARNLEGGMLAGFPLKAPKGMQFIGTPLVVDLDGQGKLDLIVAAKDSLSMVLLGYDGQLKPKSGFPLLVGSLTQADQEPLNPIFFHSKLYAVSPGGEVKAWQFKQAKTPVWGTRYGAFTLGKVSGAAVTTAPVTRDGSLLVIEETYNWPNPADELTHLRVTTTQNADVTIVVISPDGRIVYEKNLQVSGQVPVDLPLTTQHLGNGVYLASVTARSGTQKQTKIIKIAVIH